MSILIVDDSRETCRLLKEILEGKGYSGIVTLPSGHLALDFLKARNPDGVPPPVDIVLLDIDMPGLDGIEVCRRIKETPHLHDLSVLIVTGVADERVLDRAFTAGACDYLTKPVNSVELAARVRSAWNLKRELDTCKTRERELREVTEQLKRLNKKLQRLSMIDELTGISNRRFFNILLSQEWARAARDVLPLSLLLIDIDYFKNYNDEYGHPQGDRCLSAVAEALNSEPKRAGDYVARYGGEEFVVLLTHTGLQGAASFAEKLRQRVEDLNITHKRSPQGRVTISLGVAATVPERRSSSDGLISAADQAVYQSKHQGRNQVQIFQGLVEPVTVPNQRPLEASNPTGEAEGALTKMGGTP